jgi:hypothetical protein
VIGITAIFLTSRRHAIKNSHIEEQRLINLLLFWLPSAKKAAEHGR